MKSYKSKYTLLIATPILCIFFALAAINLMKPKSFYQNFGDFDAAYIPLVEPYKAIKLFGNQVNGNEHKWTITLLVSPEKKDIYYYLSIYDVTKIAVRNGVIMTYSPDSINLSDSDKQAGQKVLYWFVIVPDKNIETGFETETEFLAYIHNLGIEQPSWIEPAAAHQQLLKGNCLDWIPNCK